jgi:D-glycero-D-manno-heptose 1,7-bisphosphate phosphatase
LTKKKTLKSEKIIFLDRDGVINKNPARHDYVKNWFEFEFLPGVIKALKLLKKNGFQVFVVTNQRGVARGLMTEADLRAIHRKMQARLARNQAEIAAVYYCPHEIGECQCRKPKPGLFFQAGKEWGLDLDKAIFISNDRLDLQAGQAAGCRTILLTNDNNLLSLVKGIISGLQVKQPFRTKFSGA